MSCKLANKKLVWKFLNNFGKELTPIKIELIHIMLKRQSECGFKSGVKRELIVSNMNVWIKKLFDSSNTPSPILFSSFMNTEPFYFSNDEVARIILRWRDSILKTVKKVNNENNNN